MGLSTKDLVTSGGGGLPKTISPGNVTLKINHKKHPLKLDSN